MKNTITINGETQEISAGLTSGESLQKLAKCGDKALYLNRDDKIDIPVMPDDFIIIHGGESFVVGKPGAIEDNPPLRNPVCSEFNGGKLSLDKSKILAKELVAKDDKFPQGRLFADLSGAVDAEINGNVRLIVQNKDSYFVVPASDQSDDYVDVEECGKNDRRPPKSHKYRIRVDGQKYPVDMMAITGTAILALVGKKPGEWSLNQKLKGGKREMIKPDEPVNLSKPGIERFETVRIPAIQGDGNNSLELPPEDSEYLEANYPESWEMMPSEGGNSGVVIRGFSLPSGYTVEQADLLVIIPQGYPGAALDMFYFNPPLQKANGNKINATVAEMHFGGQWQRWSRHYSWTPGEDNLIKHIEFVKNTLKQEVLQ